MFEVNPRLIEVQPKESQKVQLGSDMKFVCNFAGNPKPEVRWCFVDAINQKDQYPQTDSGVLLIKNISYQDEGAYYCEGRNYNYNSNSSSNVISVASSSKISLDVVGKPMFFDEHEIVFGYTGMQTQLVQRFCADPTPKRIYWLVGEDRYDVE